MLNVPARIRVVSVALFVIASFVANSIASELIVYAAVASCIVVAGIGLPHLKFAAFVTLPILAALLLVWGVAANQNEIPTSHANGVSYAIFLWLRIVVCGGAMQFLFLPLAAQPVYLRHFLRQNGVSEQYAVLIGTAIVFIPEVRRRIDRITDARKAQGFRVSGLRGLLSLPVLLLPLVSSLLDSAIKRSEFWCHRGVFRYAIDDKNKIVSSKLSGFLLLATATAICIGAAFA